MRRLFFSFRPGDAELHVDEVLAVPLLLFRSKGVEPLLQPLARLHAHLPSLEVEHLPVSRGDVVVHHGQVHAELRHDSLLHVKCGVQQVLHPLFIIN